MSQIVKTQIVKPKGKTVRKIFEILLKGPAKAAEIAGQLEIGRQSTYAAINRIVDSGFATTDDTGRGRVYRPVISYEEAPEEDLREAPDAFRKLVLAQLQEEACTALDIYRTTYARWREVLNVEGVQRLLDTLEASGQVERLDYMIDDRPVYVAEASSSAALEDAAPAGAAPATSRASGVVHDGAHDGPVAWTLDLGAGFKLEARCLACDRERRVHCLSCADRMPGLLGRYDLTADAHQWAPRQAAGGSS